MQAHHADDPGAGDLWADLASLPAALYTFRIDAAGVPSFPFVSQACADLYGFSPAAAMADAALMHDAIHPDDRAGFDEAGQQSLRSLDPVRWEGRMVRRDGAVLRVLVTSRPFRQPDGATEWHGAVVERPSRATSGAPAEGLAVTAWQAEVLGMLSHDLATPLTAIVLRAELALEKLEDDSLLPGLGRDQRLVRRSLDVILRQAHRLEHLRDDLLALAAADAGVIEARPASVEVLPILEAATELARDGVAIGIDCPPGLSCEAQPSHVVQMLSNLVSNAVRYARTEVTLSVRRIDHRVLITVWHDGPGIQPDVAPRLFTRFAHAGLDVRPAGAGSGLGLSIVRTLALANHGTALHEPSGPGTRFTLALPASVER